MKKQVLSLCLILLILFSIYGVVSVATTKTQSQPMLQNKPVGCDKERTAWATCGPPFAASKKSDKYHCGECPTVKKIKPENLIWFNTTKKRAMRDIPLAASVTPLAVTACHHQPQLSQKFLPLCLFKSYRHRRYLPLNNFFSLSNTYAFGILFIT